MKSGYSEVLEAGTAEKAGTVISVFPGVPVGIRGIGLTGSDTLDIEVSDGAEEESWDKLQQDGTQIQLSAVNNAIGLFVPGRYRVYRVSTSQSSKANVCERP